MRAGRVLTTPMKAAPMASAMRKPRPLPSQIYRCRESMRRRGILDDTNLATELFEELGIGEFRVSDYGAVGRAGVRAISTPMDELRDLQPI